MATRGTRIKHPLLLLGLLLLFPTTPATRPTTAGLAGIIRRIACRQQGPGVLHPTLHLRFQCRHHLRLRRCHIVPLCWISLQIVQLVRIFFKPVDQLPVTLRTAVAGAPPWLP